MKKDTGSNGPNRRQFIQAAGAASAFAALSLPKVYAANGNETIQVALVGCGGRGSGAAVNALSVKNAQTKLVAMADVFQHQIDSHHKHLTDNFKNQPGQSGCARGTSVRRLRRIQKSDGRA